MGIDYRKILSTSQELKSFLDTRLKKYYNKKLLKRRLPRFESFYCENVNFDDFDEDDIEFSDLQESKSVPYCQIPINIFEIELDKIFSFLSENKKNAMPFLIIGRDIKFDNDGYIAGGAIANLINEYFFGVPAKINDVDYFYYDYKEKTSLKMQEYIPGDEDFEDNNEIEFNKYGYMLMGATKERMNNNIRILPSYEFEWRKILDSFDLNCTMVGFHPITKEIIFTDSFVEFLETRIIELKDPIKYIGENQYYSGKDNYEKMTQIIRANKKKNELNAIYYFDDDVRKFVYSIHYKYPVVIDNKDIRIYNYINENSIVRDPFCVIPKKEVKVLFNNQKILEPYFKIYRKNSRVYLRYLKPSSKNNEIYKTISSEYPEYYIKQFFQKIESIHQDFPIKEVRSCEFLLLKQLLFLPSIKKVRSGFDTHVDILVLYDFLRKKGCHLLRKKQIEIFEHLMNNHSSLFDSYIKYLKYSVGEFNFNYFLEIYWKIIKNEPMEYIGLFESTIRSKENLSCLDSNAFIDNIRKKYEKMMKDDILGTSISLGRYAKYCLELNKVSLLRKEGLDLNHCVGGYSQVVKDNKAKIFDLQIAGSRSTVEYRIVSGLINKYEIRQHKAKSNSMPKSQHIQLAKLLLNYLNEGQYLIKGRNKIMEKKV